jgi:hypothetical protein
MMRKYILMMLVVIVSSAILTGQAMAESKPGGYVTFLNERRHISDTLFFEQIENGVVGQYVALKFSAGEEQNETKWANCQYIHIFINKEKKLSELYMEYFSTDDNSIANLSVAPKSVSFDINFGRPEHSGHYRKMTFVANRQDSSSSAYEASGNGLWNDTLDETKSIKIEWKPVPSILLPYPISN